MRGLGLLLGHCLGLFCINDDMVGLQNMECIQCDLNIIIGLFRRYGLVANVSKSNSITCHPGEIQSGMLEELVGRQCMVRGDTCREIFRRRFPFPDCGVDLTGVSMTVHQQRIHGTEPDINWNRLPVSQMDHIPHSWIIRRLDSM